MYHAEVQRSWKVSANELQIPLQIARRVHSAEHLAKERTEAATSKAGQQRGMRAVRYQAASMAEPVFLHPTSTLSAAVPEFVAYTAVLRTPKRPYMTGGNYMAVSISACLLGNTLRWGTYHAASFVRKLCAHSWPLAQASHVTQSPHDGDGQPW